MDNSTGFSDAPGGNQEMFTKEDIIRELLARGGRMVNSQLVLQFAGYLKNPAVKEEAKAKFKNYVNQVATVVPDPLSGEKFVVLRSDVQDQLQQQQSFSGNQAQLPLSGAGQGLPPQALASGSTGLQHDMPCVLPAGHVGPPPLSATSRHVQDMPPSLVPQLPPRAYRPPTPLIPQPGKTGVSTSCQGRPPRPPPAYQEAMSFSRMSRSALLPSPLPAPPVPLILSPVNSSGVTGIGAFASQYVNTHPPAVASGTAYNSPPSLCGTAASVKNLIPVPMPGYTNQSRRSSIPCSVTPPTSTGVGTKPALAINSPISANASDSVSQHSRPSSLKLIYSQHGSLQLQGRQAGHLSHQQPTRIPVVKSADPIGVLATPTSMPVSPPLDTTPHPYRRGSGGIISSSHLLNLLEDEPQRSSMTLALKVNDTSAAPPPTPPRSLSKSVPSLAGASHQDQTIRDDDVPPAVPLRNRRHSSKGTVVEEKVKQFAEKEFVKDEIRPTLTEKTSVAVSPGTVKEKVQMLKMTSEGNLTAPHPHNGQPLRASASSGIVTRKALSSRNSNQDSDDKCSVSTLDPLRREFCRVAMSCDYQALQKMLQEDPSLARAVDYVLGYNALHWAAKYGNCDIVKLIAGTYNVDANIRTRGAGQTPLHIAYMFNQKAVIDLLIMTYGAQKDVRDFSGRKPDFYGNQKNVETLRSRIYHTDKNLKEKGELRKTGKDLTKLETKPFAKRYGSFNVNIKKTLHHLNLKNWEGLSGVDEDREVQSTSLPPLYRASRKIPKRAKRTASLLSSVTGRSSVATAVTEEKQDSDSDSAYGFNT